MPRAKSKSKDIDHLVTYEFHGVEISPSSNGEAKGTCPFCGKDKFYINKKEGLFSCKSLNTCGVSGNKYTFLEELHKVALAGTEDADYKKLSKARGGIPISAYKHAEVAFEEPSQHRLPGV